MKAIETKQELPQGTYSPAVPLGCKQTDLGVIPEHWYIRQLADICMPRGIVRGPFGGTLKKDTFVTSGFKVYEQQNAIYKSFELGSYFVDQSKYAEMHRFSVSPGDFIISCSGTIGRIFQIPPDAPQGVINQALLKLTTNDEVVYDRYFYILFEWDEFQIKIIDSTQGGAIKNLVGMDVFRTISVVLPPLSEQHAIAEALSDVDGLINALDALIAKKRAIKQATMQQLLTGKTRLPGFRGAWETKRLGEIFTILAGSSKSQYITQGGKYIVVDMGSVATDGQLIVSKFTDYEGDFLKEGDLVMPKDDIGGGKIIGKVAYIDANNLYVLGDHVYALRLIEGFPKFFSYLINRYETNSSLKSKVGGSAQLGLSRKAVVEQEVPIPTYEEQRTIAALLSDMDAEIAALEQRQGKTRAIKQGMMQQLLTGRVRLVESKNVNKT